MSAKDNWLHRVADFFSDYGSETLSVLSSIFLAIDGVLFSLDTNLKFCWMPIRTFAWIFMCISGALCVFAHIRTVKKSKSMLVYEKLLDEKSAKIQLLESTIEKYGEENYSLFKYVLISLSKSLNFNGTDRVSIYKKQKGTFQIMGRYSINPEFDKINRRYYPDNEGFIAQALRNGEFFVDGLPEFRDGNKEEYYKKVMKLCSIEKDVLRSINMKSRNVYCKALTYAAGAERKAIIVFESTQVGKFTPVKINAALTTEEVKLVAFVEKLKFKLPDSDTALASKEGF